MQMLIRVVGLARIVVFVVPVALSGCAGTGSVNAQPAAAPGDVATQQSTATPDSGAPSGTQIGGEAAPPAEAAEAGQGLKEAVAVIGVGALAVFYIILPLIALLAL